MREELEKNAIRELLARYCFALDDFRLDDLAALFTADGVWQAGYGAATGPVDIAALLRRVAPNPADGNMQRHINTNIVIDLGEAQAQVRSYYMVIRTVAEAPTIYAVGTYRDTLVKIGEGWRFRLRILSQDMRRHQ